jgi:hypothetical protein
MIMVETNNKWMPSTPSSTIWRGERKGCEG